MTQLSPTNLFNSQIASEMIQFKDDYVQGKYPELVDVINGIWTIVNKLNDSAHRPLTNYEPVVLGEPPSSDKMNRFWSSIQNDVNNIEDQVYVLQAAALFMYNYFQTEIQKQQNQNAQASNKLKTLQLYASSHDNSITTFGDYFRNQDFIDTKAISGSDLASLDIAGHVTLSKSGTTQNLAIASTVNVLPTSNGFMGNNQEIQDPSTADRDPVDDISLYKFVAESDRHSSTIAITDGDPSTWIEYESNQMTPDDRSWVKNFNLTYQQQDGDTTTLINWAKGPLDNVLKLNLEFDLGIAQSINRVSYTPFGLTSNINYPVKIASIQVSETGTDWLVLSPQNIYVGTDTNLKAANTADNVTINSAEWLFPEANTRYVRISLEQSNPVDSNIGHLYYIDKTGQRVEGPIPLLSNPAQYYSQNHSTVRGNLIQNVEYFPGKRWVIGIRDILIQQIQYSEKSVIVSKPFRVGGIVDRVVLEADLDIPSDFPIGTAWVKFFVSPDEGVNWYQISRIQDDYFGVPEEIAFNDPLPNEFHDQSVAYYTVNNTVDTLRVKVEISRPSDSPMSTPVLRSYKLKVRTR